MNFKTGGGTKSGPPEEFSIFDFRFLIWEGRSGVPARPDRRAPGCPNGPRNCIHVGTVKYDGGQKGALTPRFFVRTFTDAESEAGLPTVRPGMGIRLGRDGTKHAPVQPQRREGPQRRSAVGRTFRLFDRIDHISRKV